MVVQGVNRFRDKWDKDVRRGDLSGQPSVRDIMVSATEGMSIALSAWLDTANKGRGGRRNAQASALEKIDTDVASYLTAKAVINGAILGQPHHSVARNLGQMIEDEMMVMALIEAEEHLPKHEQAHEWVQREAKRRGKTTADFMRAYYKRMISERSIDYVGWTSVERARIGTVLIEVFCDATGLVGLKLTSAGGKKTKRVFTHTERLLTWIDQRSDYLELCLPIYQPMVEKPRAWTTLEDGGYRTHRVPLVKNLEQKERAGHRRALQEAIEQGSMGAVLDAVNTLQGTSYRVNMRVLDVLKALYDRGDGIPGIQGTEQMTLPAKPDDIATNEEARKEYRKQARDAHDHNAKAVGTKLALWRTLQIADQMRAEPAIYFPHQLDFRGRAYPLPSDLSPQGQDYARALLEFDVGKAVGEAGKRWLQINLANLWGYDKVSLDERATWAEEHKDAISEAAHNPLGDHWWREADKPFQFLAACIDFANVEAGLPSHIRVGLDGSCNGIQHFAAMLRDPVAATAVNLTDSETPRDIYQDVADVVVAKLSHEKDGQKRQWANIFRAHKLVDRKTCKRSVMVMPYGGTQRSTFDYVSDELEKRGAAAIFGDDLPQAKAYLANLVFTATREVVTSGKVVMDWLREVAGTAAKAKHHMRWETPIGFIAEQRYVKYDKRFIKTKMNGKVAGHTADYTATDKIDITRSKNGISPNFVHSLDAAAMMGAILAAHAEGVTHFHCIHDDFGTHAEDTEVLYRTLREAFVQMYLWNNVLGQIMNKTEMDAQVLLPQLPLPGTFDIQEVLRSKYFFC